MSLSFSFSRRVRIALAAGVLALLMACILPGMLQHDSVLQIRVAQAGAPLPDGFFVYQQLTAQGIHIKSITPADDALVIHFDSDAQNQAAQRLLRHLLPQGFVFV
ncbi:EnvZ/OmpR regulon moderator MzrA [Candidatus Pantoea multigeneris]|uniref:EnvZ/OmpR regulon moderator MzrA n=1 Tax=Candidatus Pantoea multigeneris TaxID=2608357 RepID=A0ABX0R9E1_9GAMM|nr:EnvZ/OmpR regulon moderator MzrA [Pantoea multigeneris]NIF21379.1 EnvZ/OmpR regulon moderator MzrA [Pantoea multigeneris]